MVHYYIELVINGLKTLVTAIFALHWWKIESFIIVGFNLRCWESIVIIYVVIDNDIGFWNENRPVNPKGGSPSPSKKPTNPTDLDRRTRPLLCRGKERRVFAHRGWLAPSALGCRPHWHLILGYCHAVALSREGSCLTLVWATPHTWRHTPNKDPTPLRPPPLQIWERERVRDEVERD